MRLDVDENYVDLVEIGKDALYPLDLEALRGVSLHVEDETFHLFSVCQETPGSFARPNGAMARRKALTEYPLKLT
jgi:hypothetical protein